MMDTKILKRNILLDYILTFIRNLDFTHGLWMIYLNAYKDLPLLEVGLLEGIFHVASITMEVPTGIIGDLVGRKFSRLLSVLTYLVFIVMMLVGTNFWFFAIAFFLCGTSYTFESGSGDALVYDTLLELNEQDKYMKVQGIKEILYQLSSSIALFIGGYIAIKHFKLNYQVVFIVFVTALIPILLMKEIKVNVHKKLVKFKDLLYEHFVNSTKQVFSNKKLSFLIIISALLAAPITSLFFYIQNYFDQNSYSLSTIGIILGLHSVAGALGGYSAHIIERKYKEKLILYIVPIFMLILLWTLSFHSYIYVPFILLGFFDSIFFVVLNDYTNRLISSDQRATVLSFGSMAFSFVMILIFPLLGFIGQISSLETSFLVLAALVTVSYVTLVFVLNNTKVLD